MKPAASYATGHISRPEADAVCSYSAGDCAQVFLWYTLDMSFQSNQAEPGPSQNDSAASSSQARTSCVVLAGGKSRRLGRDKAVEPIGGQPLIKRVFQRAGSLCDEVLVVVAEEARAIALPLEAGCRVVLDRYPGTGSLGGIFSGLAAANQPWALAVACDMPFLNLDLLRRMISMREDYDAVVPVIDGRPEPTHSLYSKSCLPFIEPRLISGDLKISGFYDEVRVRYLPQEEVQSLDPDFLSFFNVNTSQDLDEALALAARGL